MTTVKQTIIEKRALLEWAEESYSEKRGQYESECALFGDAWAGAQIELSQLRRQAARLRGELEELCSTPDGRAFIEVELAKQLSAMRAAWVESRG